MNQGRLFTEPPDLNVSAATAARDRAVRRAEENADPRFTECAWRAIQRVAGRCQFFIVDDVWREMQVDGLIPGTPDKRAMGAVMMRAVRAGYIKRTAEYQPSAQPQCHSNPRRVWRSLLILEPAS